MTGLDHPAEPDRPLGRPRATTHDELEAIGMDLFGRRGYENVSVQQIAEAAGVSRRTFFRYFPTKSDLPWGDFAQEVDRLRSTLALVPDQQPLMAALRRAVVEFNRVPAEAVEQHRARLGLILSEPELIARSLLKFQLWREVIAEFAGRRLGMPGSSFLPELIGEIALSAAVAAYREWIPHPSADLPTLIDTAFEAMTDLEGLEHGSAATLAQRIALPDGRSP
ncbi:mycofactocin system transcriptional regulator [Citricoccus nitrophenolicus]|uniref:Mycofactocin system transcriptional regulator n=1 Tax=Citricoccus nitrophenolicus TaxID=863575 RepID=A0ABV0IDV5_9MICC|nr:mycofactocin system transcriptional regulator [Citricoccus sp. I39-566]WMY77208.1 mycofactocin system transcriptional regulator [Citricoccus sp. I39-566]